MELWTALYLSVELLSLVSTLAIVVKLLRHRQESVNASAVYWLLVVFFGDLTVWAMCRALFFVLYHPHDPLDDPLDKRMASTTGSYLLEPSLLSMDELFPKRHAEAVEDVLGPRRIRDFPIAQLDVMVVTLAGDAALLATALTLLAMTRELFVLAKVTMDRGMKREKQVIRRYLIAIHLVTALFSLVQVLMIVLRDGVYDAKVLYITDIGLWLQTIDLLGVILALAILKCKGRNVESVHGSFVTSPLYIRIRNLFIIFGVFSVQYQVFSFEFFNNSLDHVPSWVIGVSTVWFRSIGIALAFLMGCSQEWVARSFHCCLPKDYVDSLTAPSASLLTDSCVERILPPTKNPVFVFTDIESSSALWALENGSIMRPANELHDDILRSLLLKHHGYEITTAGDAFQLAFSSIQDAVEYCVDAQLQLLHAKWSKSLRNCGINAASRQRVDGRKVFDGLRVRMGIHDAQESSEGKLVYGVHPVTNRATYTGLSEVIANQIGDLGQGGQVLMTSRVAEWVMNSGWHVLTHACEAEFVGRYAITSVNEHVNVYQLVIEELRPRVDFFTHSMPRKLKSCVQIQVVHDEYPWQVLS